MYLFKKINTNNEIIDKIVHIFKNMLKKNLSKNPFYEKVKIFTKGQFMVESFVIINLFCYDYMFR